MTPRKETEEFDIANHVFCVDEAITLDEVLQYCQQQSLVPFPSAPHAQEPMNPNLPLWKVIIFSNLKGSADAQSVLLFRYHRCLADGFSLMQMLLTESRYAFQEAPISRESLLQDASDSPSSASNSPSGNPTAIAEPHTEVVSEVPLVLVSSEQEHSLYPSLLAKNPKPPCGLRNSSAGSFWRLVCTQKDRVSPLRSKKVADAPRTRFAKTKILGASIDEVMSACDEELTINDLVLGAVYHAVVSFFGPRCAQEGNRPVHVGDAGASDA